MTNETLEHAGVKGMKWGVKKSKEERSADRSKIRKAVGENYDPRKMEGRIRTTATFALGILNAPLAAATVGMNIAKSSGYSTGASVATGLLGGVPGGILMSEIAVRKRQLD